MWRLALAVSSLNCLLLAVDVPEQKEKLQQTKTERMDFPSGGLLRLNGWAGEVTIAGWDQPGIEITTTRVTREEYDPAKRQQGATALDEVRVASERHGDELVITTSLPRHGGRFRPPLPASTPVDLVSHIYLPHSARLAIEHGSGNLYIEEVRGNIEAGVGKGTILLRLAGEGEYDIDARSKWGSVSSDFPGQVRKARWLVGQQFAGHPEGHAQKLQLRAGYGDIIILKERLPKEPAPLQASGR